jgi:hypothetical protein
MKRLLIVIIGCFLLASVVPGNAGEVIMKNGDRISGAIVKKDGKLLIVKTSYAGDISINWEDVNTLSSDVNMQIVLADGTSINGNAIQSQPGSITIKSGQILETAPISLEQISAINPPSHGEAAAKFSGHVNAGFSMNEGNTNTKKFISTLNL